ncbi:MAG TPA: hypothetical protein VFT22_29420 [Kofleriaceae bacterium]|nr:hypothetical protein [Kofleriaceae bacterium]
MIGCATAARWLAGCNGAVSPTEAPDGAGQLHRTSWPGDSPVDTGEISEGWRSDATRAKIP